MSQKKEKESFFKIIQSWKTFIQCQEKWLNFIFCTFLINLFVEVWIKLICICFFGGNLSCEFSQIFSQYQFHFYDFSCRVARSCSWVILIFLLIVISFGRDFKRKKCTKNQVSSYSSILLKWHHWFGLLNRRSSQIAI